MGDVNYALAALKNHPDFPANINILVCYMNLAAYIRMGGEGGGGQGIRKNSSTSYTLHQIYSIPKKLDMVYCIVYMF